MIFHLWSVERCLAVLFLRSMVMALPDGCPVCTVGNAAPQSLHLFNQVTGPISTGQFQVTIDGAIVTESPNILRIAPETDLPLLVSSTTGTQFRGILVVLNREGINLLNRLMPTSTSFKAQQNCVDMDRSGITHVNNELKSSASATIRLPSNLTAFLDVNIVLINRIPGGSTFYYSRFQITTVVQGAPVPVSMAPIPVPVPITAPVTLPVSVPVPAPMVPMPMPVTVENPVLLPITEPVSSPMAPLPVTTPEHLPVIPPIPVPIILSVPLPISVPVANPAPPSMAAPSTYAPIPVAAPMPLPTTSPTRRRCGLFGLGLLCFNGCGILGRIFRFCSSS